MYQHISLPLDAYADHLCKSLKWDHAWRPASALPGTNLDRYLDSEVYSCWAAGGLPWLDARAFAAWKRDRTLRASLAQFRSSQATWLLTLKCVLGHGCLVMSDRELCYALVCQMASPPAVNRKHHPLFVKHHMCLTESTIPQCATSHRQAQTTQFPT